MRSAMRFLALHLLRVRPQYSDQTHLLHQNGVIVCANHVSFLDGVLIALASPVPLVFGSETEFSRNSKLARRGMAFVCWLCHAEIIPLDSGAPFGLRAMLQALRSGKSVMIFPEGQISKDGQLGQIRPGVSWLAQRSGAPIVWIKLVGPERSRFFSKSGRELWPRITILF